MRTLIGLATALAAAAIPVVAVAQQPDRPIGKQTSIPFAARHELRDWTAGEAPDILYVQDYRRNWYRVRLSGPCADDMAGPNIAYTTGPTGAFDRFSRVYNTEYPSRSCGVVRIETSLAPPDRQPDSPDEQ